MTISNKRLYMKKLNLIERAPIKKVLSIVANDKPILQYLKSVENTSTFSSIRRSFGALYDIIVTNGEKDCIDNLIKYKEGKISEKERLLIRHGNLAVNKYSKKLKNRKRPKNFSVLTIDYWIKRKGLTLQDAVSKVAQLQSANARKRTKNSYRNTSVKLKYSLDYWMDAGYSKEEGELLRAPYLKPMLNNRDAYFEKYGKDLGLELYEKRIEKYKTSMFRNRHNRKSAGYVSKESLKFFIPLYKKCRRLGISRDEIFLGVNGSKEFFIRTPGTINCGRFFDFCIPNLKIVIEYNGAFWHPRDEETWKNPWVSYQDAILVEGEKLRLCNGRKFELYYVWSDEDLSNKVNDMFSIIRKKYYESRKSSSL